MRMRDRLLSGFLLFLFAALPAFGQGGFTTVSGVIVDPNGIPWSGGTVSAQFISPGGTTPTLNGQPFTSTTASGLLGPGGSFTMRLGDNGVIACPTSPCGTWQFTINIAPGVLPPAGKGPQSFTVTTAINCGTNTPSTCTSNAMTITSTLAPVPALSFGGGPATVSSLPATCTVGQQVSLAVNGVGYGIFRCVATNVWAPDDPQQSVSPLAYGAKWDVKAVTDCTFTNASNVVACPSAESKFTTSASLGQLAFGTTHPQAMTTGCNGVNCGSVVIPLGFICTITNDGSVSLGTSYPACAADNATAACTPNSTTLCDLVWGTQDDSTAIQAAVAAAWTGNSCKAVVFPSGMAFFTVPSGGLLNVVIPQGSPCSGTRIADYSQAGPMVYGAGPANSVLVPLPSVNFANCTGGNSATACIAGPPNWFAHDWGVWGFGQADNGTTHNNKLIEFYGVSPSDTATSAWNMAFNGWETASAGSRGFNVNYGAGVLYFSNIISEGFGNTNCFLQSAGGNLTVSGLDCFGSSGGAAAASLEIGSGSFINSTGGQYWGGNINSVSASDVYFSGTNTTFNSFGDVFIGIQNGNNDFVFRWATGSGTTLNLSGANISGSNTTGGGNSYVFFCASGSTCPINAYSSFIAASGSKMAMFLTGGANMFNFNDACGNTFTQGGVANSALNIFGSCSITGTTVAAGNLVLSAGWGSTAAWSNLSGSTQQTNGTITASGVGQAANPTITYTFPTPFLQTPTVCFGLQVGGTQTAVANPFTPSALSKTGVTLTYNGTPVAGNTLQVVIQCWNP
jgi:hypothetical protein